MNCVTVRRQLLRQPRSGNGSLELTGDRTRFAAGNIYPSATSVSPADLSTVTGLTFDWRIAAGSTTNYNVDYTPALRLHIFDTGANVRKERIWEGAYNNTYGNTARNTWYTSSALDKFYITGGSENAGMTIAQWASTLDTGSFVSDNAQAQKRSARIRNSTSSLITLPVKNPSAVSWKVDGAFYFARGVAERGQ
jgi:hypothetical protein